MSKVILPMESYRLAGYSVQVPCYICGEGNTFDAELCRHCFAPMALAHQANAQKVRPQMVAVIGSSGVGKTVYLGMLLDMLSRSPQRMQILARGAFSITLQQTVMAALARGEFPPKTPNEPDRWSWVHCQIRTATRRQPTELIVPDMAGEAVLEEVDHPHTYLGIRRFLNQCAGALILIDAAEMENGTREQDYFAMKLLSYLSELCKGEQQTWRDRPVALVLSKADQCETCFDDPAAYAQKHAEGLWQHCVQRFTNHKFFASGVAGVCLTRWVRGEGRSSVPLRIEPRGIVEPFEWLVKQVNR
jgi:double-GTPase-like protein